MSSTPHALLAAAVLLTVCGCGSSDSTPASAATHSSSSKEVAQAPAAKPLPPKTTPPATPPTPSSTNEAQPMGTTPASGSSTAPTSSTTAKPATPAPMSTTPSSGTQPSTAATKPTPDKSGATAISAMATLTPTAGHDVRGTVTFTPSGAGVMVHVSLTGLTPGNHGFHVHEKGDCSSSDGMSAGDHFNPTHMQHGGPQAADRHEGDLGNIVADEQGKVEASFLDEHLALDGPNSIVDRAVIVHEKPDDLTTQPSGNAGARLACGVIEKTAPAAMSH